MSLNLHFRKLGFSFFLARNHRTLGISHGISFRSFKKNGGWHDLQVNPQPAHFHQPWPEVKMQMQQKTKEGWVKFCQPTTKCVCIILQINDKYIYIFVYKCMIICIYIYYIWRYKCETQEKTAYLIYFAAPLARHLWATKASCFCWDLCNYFTKAESHCVTWHLNIT